MQLRSDTLRDGQPIPAAHAFCPSEGHTGGHNRSPHLAWDDAPEGARSFAVLCVDPDAPASREGVGEAGVTVAYDRPRADFVHWVLVDVPGDRRDLAEGADADGVTAGGKPGGPTPHGVRGRNAYTDWFAGDPDMAGVYHGYDGPCPPANDARVHRYRFTVVALDVPTLDLDAGFTAADARAAMAGHVLAEATLTGTYSLNPTARL